MKTVLCHGTFDLVHAGHIAYLRACRAYGGTLMVALSTDHMAMIRKGDDRPIIPYEQRKDVLEAIRYVDTVIAAPDTSDDLITNLLALIENIRPAVFVTSYKAFKKHASTFTAQGTRLIIRKESPLSSSTEIINRIRSIEHN